MGSDREQRIRDRAYALWEQEGGGHGRHQHHWGQAIAEIDAAAEHESDDKPAAAGKSAAPAKLKSEKGSTSHARSVNAAPVSAGPATIKAATKPARRAKPRNG